MQTFDEYGNYKSRHIPDPVVIILEPVPNADVDAPADPVDDDAALDIQVHDSTSLREVIYVRLNLDTYVVVAHEYMAPSELSKLTLDG
jgi:hypothetical protein